jgi:hypothetical protein
MGGKEYNLSISILSLLIVKATLWNKTKKDAFKSTPERQDLNFVGLDHA